MSTHGGSSLSSRLGLIAFELVLVGVVWYLGYLPHVIAGGLAAIIVVSGLVPERWSTLTTGVLMLIGAAVMYAVYPAPGDRNRAMLIAAVGLLFTIYGAIRARSMRG
ncbi:MAG: hypothetical protein ACKVU4_12135 [Phycisphaerales bacterium]